MQRKTFIKNTLVGAAAFAIVPRHVLGGKGYVAPNDRINLGFIGVGKQARGLLNNMSKLSETLVLAASDVDKKKLDFFERQVYHIYGAIFGRIVYSFRIYSGRRV